MFLIHLEASVVHIMFSGLTPNTVSHKNVGFTAVIFKWALKLVLLI